MRPTPRSSSARPAPARRIALLPVLLALLLAALIAPGRGGATVAAGGTGTLALATGGVLGAWGNDSNGQLGDGTVGTPSKVATPQAVPGVADIIAIAGGTNHTLALKADHTVLAWGDDGNGQLGDGTAGGSAATPQPVIGIGGVGLLGNIVAIAAGEGHSLALRDDGKVVAWGDNIDGQLGNGTRVFSATPLLALAAPGVPLSGVQAIDAGNHHTLALKSDGTLLAWGLDIFGALGDGVGTTTGCACHPTPQPVLAAPGVPLTGVAAISAAQFSLALLTDGTVLAWGPDSVGQLGDGAAGGADPNCVNTCRATPQPVVGVGGVGTLSGIAAIATGGGHALARKTDGTLVAWGWDVEGQLGDGTPQTGGCQCNPSPQVVPNVSGASAIAVGAFHNLVLKEDGTLLAWGQDFYGELGDGAITTGGCFCHATPQRVPGVARVAAIAVGSAHSLVIADVPAATTTAADNRAIPYGTAALTLSATVASGAGTANGGTVTFTVKDAGGATLGSPVSGTVDATGVASALFAVPAGTAAGSYTIGASFGGTFSFSASTDPTPTTLAIERASTSTTIGAPAAPSCATTVVTIPVTVANTSNAVALTGGSVTVILTQGATTIGVGSAAVSGATPATVNVSVAISGLAVGSVTADASYGGDANFQGSVAASSSFASAQGTTTVAVPTATATYGDGSATLTATVTSLNGAELTGGTVTFVVKQGGTTVATLTSGAVVGASPVTVGVTLPLGAANNAGNYSIQASYSGDTCFASGQANGTLKLERRILAVKASDRTVVFQQPNPPTTPPANCLASATATTACWLELVNGSGFVYGQSWSSLNLANLRFTYARNYPSSNASETVGKTYKISATGFSSTNYDLRIQQGTLTVVAP